MVLSSRTVHQLYAGSVAEQNSVHLSLMKLLSHLRVMKMMMSKPIEMGTRFHEAYQLALQNERDTSHVTLILWFIAVVFFFGVKIFGSGMPMEWVVFWWVWMILSFIGMSLHFSSKAMIYRAHRQAERSL